MIIQITAPIRELTSQNKMNNVREHWMLYSLEQEYHISRAEMINYVYLYRQVDGPTD